jgi:hypothetical protein
MTTPILDAHGVYNAQPGQLEQRLSDIALGIVDEHGRRGPGTLSRGLLLRLTGKPKGTLQAYVSDNRWVVDCGVCYGGIAVADVRAPFALCLACGTRWSVEFPKDRKRAETLLLKRLPENRHWFPDRGETVDMLEIENVIHLERDVDKALRLRAKPKRRTARKKA